MALKLYDEYIKRIADGYSLAQPVYDETQVATGGVLGVNLKAWQKMGVTKALPSPLPNSVTAYVVTRFFASSGVAADNTLLFGKLINFGSLDISSNVFTDGSTMPTVTVLGVSRALASPVWIEVTTALNATPGNISITYVDQDGNAAESTTTQNLVASSAVKTSGVILLNSTDWGVRDITSAVRGGGTTPTGVIGFWGMIPLCMTTIAPVVDEVGFVVDFLNKHCNQFRLGAGDVLGAFVDSAAARSVLGTVVFVGDT